MKYTPLKAAILASIITPAYADNTLLNDLYVSANPFVDNALQTPYSTQEFSQQEIAESGANTLNEFLTQNTSLLVQPSYGNPFVSQLDMNGYGTANGHENIKIIVDGVALNNIDLAPVQLSAINLENIESISILKGAGSVLYGNGSAAGAIVINTVNGFNTKSNAKASLQYGSYKTERHTFSALQSGQHNGFDLFASAHIDTYSTDGSIQVKDDGRKNSADNQTISAQFGVQKDDTSATIAIDKNSADVLYPSSLDEATFKDKPDTDQSFGTAQEFNTLNTRLQLQHALNNSTRLSYTLFNNNKDSTYVDFGSSYEYQSLEHKLDLKTQLQDVLFQYGVSTKQAQRDSSGFSVNETSMDNAAVYASVDIAAGDNWMFNVGARQQTINYQYKATGANNTADESLSSWNLGANYLINAQSSVFANLNQAFLAPNIDRFFAFGGSFNGFIKPQISRTLTLGYKAQHENTQFTLEAFSAELEDEIYYNNVTFQNTNLESTQKQGLNIALQQYFSQGSAGLNYAYVDATIEDDAASGYSDKKLPGVAEHTINLFAQYDLQTNWLPALPQHRLKVNHKASTDAYAISDFGNNNGRQPTYQTTDVSYRMSNKTVSVQLGINNLLDETNGTYLESGGSLYVYPNHYERTFYLKADIAL